MKRGVKILSFYIIGLLLCSVVLKLFKVENYFNTFDDSRTSLLNPMLLLTVVGGLVSLRMLVSKRAFSAFLIIYSCLWIIRYILLLLAGTIGEMHLLGKSFHFDIIIPNYYSNVSRLGTPLPFVIFWLLHYLFSRQYDTQTSATSMD